MTDLGYKFVQLPEKVNRAVRPEATHNRCIATAITAAMEITLVNEQPLHVGSGFKMLREDRIVRAAVTSGGIPCIPGSTVKGVLRSRYEAITKSCALFKVDKKFVKIRSKTFKDTKARFSEDVRKHNVFGACKPKALCAACALFGCMSLRGRVTISDFMPNQSTPLDIAEVAEMFSPNLHHLGPFHQTEDGSLEVDGLYGRKFACGHGPEAEAKQWIEVIPANSCLTGTLRVVNVTKAELGGLLAALGVRPKSYMRLGAGKSHGFGRVRVDRCDMVAHPADNKHSFDESAYEEAFRETSDAWLTGLDELVRIHTGDNQ